MSLRKLLDLKRSLAFRLTLMYAAIFGGCAALLLTAAYFMIASNMNSQIDRELIEESREVRSGWKRQGVEGVKNEIRMEVQARGARDIYFRLSDEQGNVLASTDSHAWNGLAQEAQSFWAAQKETPVIETIRVHKGQINARLFQGMLDDGVLLQIGQSLKDNERLLERIRWAFTTVLFTFVGLAIAVGWMMARRALSGVEKVTATAAQIALGSFDSRVPVRGAGDEIDRLAVTFNSMLSRIQTLMAEMKEMGDNIAHDLKSPITRIRGNTEMALAQGNVGSEFESVAGETIEECDRLLAIINTMLEISEAEAGVDSSASSEVDLVPMIRNIGELYQPATDDKGLRFSIDLPPECRVLGNQQKIYRAVINIVDNALKYTPEGGSVGIKVARENGTARIRVEDTGIGVAQEDLGKIFERFYRTDASRTKPGNGLGLSLARALVRAHGGEIRAESAPGRGAAFTILLPALHGQA